MSSHAKPAPKHRAATPHRAPRVARRAAAKTSLTLSSMAVVATGVAVGTGSLSLPAVSQTSAHQASSSDSGRTTAASRFATAPLATALAPAASATASTAASSRAGQDAAATAGRSQLVTRSDSREAADPLKADALSLAQGNTLARSENLSDEAPQLIAQALLSEYGWSADQFSCLDSLWTRESNWNVHADNPSSSAYGIPQALPGSKMASAGPDWANNAVTQIKWGLGYIAERYGSPCGAWSHSQSSGFY